MYAFILNMWIMNRMSEDQVQTCVSKGYITQEESNMIMATPKNA